MKPEVNNQKIRIGFTTAQVRSATVCGLPVILSPGFARVATIHDHWRFDVNEPDQMAEEIKRSGLGAHLFSFTQRLPHVEPRFAYAYKLDNIAALPISTYEEWWHKHASPTARNKVRKAAKSGVTIRPVEYNEELVRGIQSIYNESPMRQGKPFAHYGKTLEELWEIHVTYVEKSTFFGAFYGEELIGFVKLVDAGPFVRTMGIISKLSHRPKAANNALMSEAVRFCCDKGTGYLMYEAFEWGKRGNPGLTEYKKENGFQKMLVPRYYIPLTAIGRVILGTGLEEGLQVIERLPAPVVRSLLEIRRIVTEFKYSRA